MEQYKPLKIILPLVAFMVLLQNINGQKNVLLLMSDDFNLWLNKIGYNTQAITPNLDKLADKGVLFTDAHSPSPVCNPSRNALMSGLRPSTTGISSNSGGYFRDIEGFEDVISMNQFFLEQGYFVYGGGKIYHPGTMNASKHDVDPENWTEINSGGNGCNSSAALIEYSEPKRINYKKLDIDITECSGYQLASDFAEKITNYGTSAHKDKPFFMACGVFRPHLGWNSPKYFWDQWDTEDIQLPKGLNEDVWATLGVNPGDSHDNITADGKWKEAIHAYLASVSYADSALGVVLDALYTSDYANNTVIVFCGDHGWNLGEKGHWGKFSYWDQANHTSMIIYNPSAEGNGRICKKVVSMQDIYPTLVDLCGFEKRWHVEGNSLQPLLNNPADETWQHPVLMTYNGHNYIKTNKWRYIEDWDMLFDMESDPFEWNNLINEPGMDDVVNMLKGQMDSIMDIGSEIKEKLGDFEDPHEHDDEILASVENHSIPGIIEAEAFDNGGEGFGYSDTEQTNKGGDFRTGEGVDIEVCFDSKGYYNVGWVEQDEWLKYTMADVDSGNYNIQLRYATPKDGQQFTLEHNESLLGTFDLTNTGDWQKWKTITLENINIDPKEENTLKLSCTTANGANLNYINFSYIDPVGIKSTIKSSEIAIGSTVTDNCLWMDLTYSNVIAHLKTYNMNGKLIVDDYVAGEEEIVYEFPKKLQKGSYILQVLSEGNITAQKIVVN